MKTFLRLKLEGLRVLELDIDTIRILQIEAYDEGEYGLFALTDTQAVDLKQGTFDDCHAMLNKINEELGLKIVDL